MSAIPRSAEEARDLLESVRDRVDDVQARMDAFSAWKDHTNDRVDELEAENQTLRNRLDALESRLDVLEDGASSKEGKVRKIVEYAENKRSGKQTGVVVKASEVKGAAGCSRRYAYDLVDDLPDEYPWILSREQARRRQYGNLELNSDNQVRAVVIDCEALHNDPEAVNKFTTPRTSEEGSA